MTEPRAELDTILERYRSQPTALLQVLREAQEIEGWLPPATITYLAQRLGLPRARVEGVAGFYSFLHLERGEIRAHHSWWLEHLPKGMGRKNGIHHNWWQYILNPNNVRT